MRAKKTNKQASKQSTKVNKHARNKTLLLLLHQRCMGLITWSDTSNAATDALVDACGWILGPWVTQLCRLAYKKDMTMKTATLRVLKCPQDISECMCVKNSPWTYHGAMWHYVQLWSEITLLTETHKKTKETKITCVANECLQCKIPPMHEKEIRGERECTPTQPKMVATT